MQLELDNQPWSIGAAEFWIDEEIPSLSRNKNWTVVVKCRLGRQPSAVLAFLDTGCELSVIGEPWASTIRGTLGAAHRTASLSTRLGTIDGECYRCSIELLAQFGEPLSFDAELLLCARTLPFPPTIGYRNALDRIRFALDPSAKGEQNLIYFGRPA